MIAQQTLLETRDGPGRWGQGGAGAVRPVPLDEATEGPNDRRRRGGPVNASAERDDRCRLRIGRVIPGGRPRRVPGRKHDYVYNPSFDAPDAASTILAPMPAATHGTRSAIGPPAGKSPDLVRLQGDAPLLSREQEAHLFRKLNYLKYRAARLSEAPAPARPRAADRDEIERLEAEARAVRDRIIRANLRLVVAIARRRVGPGDDLFELISDGNMSLIRAVERFDYARGFKFSTYASRAIVNDYAWGLSEERTRRARFATGHEETFEAADHRTNEHESECAQERLQAGVRSLLGRLNDREHRIIVGRYGLDGADKLTLEQLGKELGVTKERARQIEARALQKLRELALEQHIEPPAT